ncbi:group III truncated hemoglobin [Sulfitobacter dubius]|uniref:group III truncated hemoglobin n=1 Tax=Sulfitobacter dubius TaxID=218673 RepID=UPI00294282EA|nr:group III truncated hemoglobin [Sulfitobacter dubius]WOI31049.1 group III truncated hemoglobin [Sulfitobacter dubius]
MTMPPRIAVTEAQIDRVVAKFYSAVRREPTLAPIFAAHVTEWPAHEEKIVCFWRNALLLQRSYEGNPMHVHQAAGNVHPEHFPIWLELFDQVLAQELPADHAQSWSALAHRVGRGLSYGLKPKEAAGAIPRLSLH